MRQLHTIAQVQAWLSQNVTRALQSDSRKVQAGDGFVAWPGAATDARRHVTTALAQGAAVCLVEHEGVQAFGFDDPRIASYAHLKRDIGPIAAATLGEPSNAMSVVAVTGTNGKTSTAWWLAQGLSGLPLGQRIPCGVIGTLGVGCPPAIGALAPSESAGVLETGLTTPDPVLLQRTLRAFCDSGLQACAIEASSIGIEEFRLNGTQFRVAIFTNFTQDHLDYHGSMEAYWESKAKLFAWEGLEYAVINLDDPQGELLAAMAAHRGVEVWSVSMRNPARLRAHKIVYSGSGLSFEVTEGGEGGKVCRVETRMIGDYNVSNLLGVIAAMRCLGVPLVDAAAVCAHLQPVPGRMECLGGHDAPVIAVDYAHTPDALAKALAALRPLAQSRGGQLWCVFGCGGDRDNAKRPLMGALAVQHADHVIVTSDNPRSEKPEAIVAQILLGAVPSQAVQVHVDRATAIAIAVAQAQPQDVILLAGKGHESTQDIAGIKLPFSDVAQAQAALQQRQVALAGANA
jgi:UDP-N-acetylmuramyl-tripeptide synthetase